MSSVQPKFKDCFYDYDKHPENLRAWFTLIGNLVRSIEHGIELELFLDKYLKRQSPTNFTKPAFLDGPVLSLPQDNKYNILRFTAAHAISPPTLSTAHATAGRTLRHGHTRLHDS